jgi:hypothetical protein
MRKGEGGREGGRGHQGGREKERRCQGVGGREREGEGGSARGRGCVNAGEGGHEGEGAREKVHEGRALGRGECYVFTGLSYLIALPDSLSLGLSFFHLISHPIHCARLVSPCDLLIRSCDLLSCSTTFYHYYSYY